jgi:hypothetical protein
LWINGKIGELQLLEFPRKNGQVPRSGMGLV